MYPFELRELTSVLLIVVRPSFARGVGTPVALYGISVPYRCVIVGSTIDF